MKIVLISSTDIKNPYGSTTRPYYISKNLSKLGCQILHVCNYYALNENDDNIKYILKKRSTNRIKLLRLYSDFVRIYIDCKKFNPDVFYIHQLSNGLRLFPLKYLLNKPVVFDAHGSSCLELLDKNNKRTRKTKFLEQFMLKVSDKIIVVSKELENFFISTYNIQRNKLVLIKNGADIDSFIAKQSDLALRKKFNIDKDDKIIFFTCPRSFPSNNIALEYLFSLVPSIEKTLNYKVKFIITGGGPELKPPSDNVIYTGFVKDLASYINMADVCIAPYPSSAVCGGTRNKVVDYFACGKPVVSTKEGMRGFDDALPNVHFLLALDSDDFVKKLIFALNNENVSKKLGENARTLAFKYDWKELSKEVLFALKISVEGRKKNKLTQR